MFGLPMNTVLAIAVAAVTIGVFVYMNRDKLPAIKLPWGKATTKAKPDRKAILAILDDAFTYFDDAKCPEGKAAIKAAMGHVYHEAGGHS